MTCACDRKPGFTLIELLIVVAIIAILAAIAVPNFLEAQTRSKVSRCKADMRSCATALETYRVDTNRYPAPIGYEATSDGYEIADPCDDPFEGFLPYRLTTPVAYLTSLPIDVFKVENAGEHPYDVPFHYSEQKTNEQMSAPEPDFLADLYETLTERRAQPSYFLFSHGPCLKHIDGSEETGPPVLYDPTNGTTSIGNVYYFGPGHGLMN